MDHENASCLTVAAAYIHYTRIYRQFIINGTWFLQANILLFFVLFLFQIPNHIDIF